MIDRTPGAIFYKGWMIQYHTPTDAYFVYQRADHRKPADIIFESLNDAKDYIDDEIAEGFGNDKQTA